MFLKCFLIGSQIDETPSDETPCSHRRQTVETNTRGWPLESIRHGMIKQDLFNNTNRTWMLHSKLHSVPIVQQLWWETGHRCCSLLKDLLRMIHYSSDCTTAALQNMMVHTSNCLVPSINMFEKSLHLNMAWHILALRRHGHQVKPRQRSSSNS